MKAGGGMGMGMGMGWVGCVSGVVSERQKGPGAVAEPVRGLFWRMR